MSDIKIKDRTELTYQSHLLNLSNFMNCYFQKKYPRNENESVENRFTRFIIELSQNTDIGIVKLAEIFNCETDDFSLRDYSKIESYLSSRY